MGQGGGGWWRWHQSVARLFPEPSLPACGALQVRDFYAAHLSPSSATRRKLSLHVVGRSHAVELAAPAPPGVELVAGVQQLQELGQRMPLWPALLGDAHAC